MDDQLQRLVDKVWNKFLVTSPEHRLMIGIGGIPGSGKTTLSLALTKALNARHMTYASNYPTSIAAFVPMDGFHLTRAQLSAMPDPAHAHARRGAEFTFDGAAFLALVQALREPLPKSIELLPKPTKPLPKPIELLPKPIDPTSASASTSSPSQPSPTTSSLPSHPLGTILAPSFDHAVKDPKANDIAVLPTHRIVVFEGNYVALAKQPWQAAAALMDEVWFVEVDFPVARRRLAARHVRAGLVATDAEGDRRAVENDLPNGEEIVGARVKVDEVVRSREDAAWPGQCPLRV